MSEAIGQYRTACRRFSEVVAEGAGRWANPSPCAGWDARAVVEHVIGTHDELLLQPAGTKRERPHDDPIARWDATLPAIDSAIEAPSSGVDLDRLLPDLTIELLAHTWDLAKAIGVEPHLDAELCEISYLRVLGYDEQIRSTGLFAAAVPVHDDTDFPAKFIAFFGRDPEWTPESS